MKTTKIILLLLFIIIIQIQSIFALTDNASTNKSFSEKPLVGWEFSPEVSTSVGFNLDTKTFGIKGITNVSLTSTIYKKANYLTGNKKDARYGYITIKDLEIKIFVDSQTADYTSTDPTNNRTFSIKYGTIEGTVQFGPLVYLKLASVSHDEIKYARPFFDKELGFSNIGYDIIPPSYTGSYRGAYAVTSGVVIEGSGTGLTNGGPVSESLDEEVDPNFEEQDLGALALGFKIPGLFNFEVGFSTKYSFYQNRKAEVYNPMLISLLFDFAGMEKAILTIKSTLPTGNNGNHMFQEGNPISLGILYGYKLKAGNIQLIPNVGFEVQIESRPKLAEEAVIYGNNPGKGVFDGAFSAFGDSAAGKAKADAFNPVTIDTINREQTVIFPFEFVVGFIYDWKDRGVTKKEDKHLKLAPGEVVVSDGASVAVLLGRIPYKAFPTLAAPYIGVKFAMWDSEDANYSGLFKHIKLGVITNLNFTLGGSIDISPDFGKINGVPIFDSYELSYQSRIDLGIGIEASYKAHYFAPFVGLLFKQYDLANSPQTVRTKYNDLGTNAGVSAADAAFVAEHSAITIAFDNFYSQTDMRVSLGVGIEKFVRNTVFTMEWQSGNLFSKDTNYALASYSDTNYFKNTNPISSTKSSDYLATKLGVISMGTTITF